MTEPALAAHLRALLAEEPGTVVAAWLFGSRARGEERPERYVDLGVLFDPPPSRSSGTRRIGWRHGSKRLWGFLSRSSP